MNITDYLVNIAYFGRLKIYTDIIASSHIANWEFSDNP